MSPIVSVWNCYMFVPVWWECLGDDIEDIYPPLGLTFRAAQTAVWHSDEWDRGKQQITSFLTQN
jgi:hypothetical protein